MKCAVKVRLLVAALSLLATAGAWAQVAAIVPGGEISRAELIAAGTEEAQVARLRDLVLEKVIRHYVAGQRLAATPAEIAELAAYHREFDRRDRAQRARKLEELNQRLAGLLAGRLESAERTLLEEFRAVLVRLAAQDAENDRAPPPDATAQAAPYVEWWKANKALYEQYGGAVALTRDGPVAQGAGAALIADYERQGLVRIPDARLREALFALLAQPPAMPVPPEGVDFTPYWKRPIPPSYFAD